MFSNSNDDTINVQSQQNTLTGDVLSWEQLVENERTYSPFVDIYETQDNYVLVANMPGVSKENLRLKLDDGSLIIFGKINYEQSLRRKYLLKENGTGNYFRKFNISDSIDESKIEAKYENGQLIVKLPKHERLKPRTIEIK